LESLIKYISFLFLILTLKLNIASTQSFDSAYIACQKEAPFILIDVFSKEDVDYGDKAIDTSIGAIDIDGDNIQDVLHGDFVSRIFQNSGQKLIHYGLKAYNQHQITSALGNLRYFIESGKINRPAGIIMPITLSLSKDIIEKNYLAIPKVISHPEHFMRRFQDKVLEVDGKGSPFMIFKSFIDSFKDLGVPLFVPAGNNYSTKINMASLLGAQSIGALHYHGKKVAAYSDQSPITTLFRQGDILSTQVKDGIDLNQDGRPDFLTSELSGGAPVVLSKGLKDIPLLKEYDPNVPEFFMSSKKFNQMAGIHNLETLNQIDQDLGHLIHFPSHHYYRRDEKGIISFKPIKVPFKYVQYNYGTSFAIGNICQ